MYKGLGLSFIGYRLINIFYEVSNTWYHVQGFGIEFYWEPSHCGLYWNEISDKLAKQGAIKNMSEISSNNLLLSSHEINSLLKKTVYKQIEKKEKICDTFLF